MNFDLRLPIGIMFTVFGVIVTAIGVIERESSTRLDININLVWGLVMLAFGGFMLLLALRGKSTSGPPDQTGSAKS